MSSAASPSRHSHLNPQPESLGRVAFLTNMLPPYRLPAMRALSEQCSALKIFLSTIVEPNRSWEKEWAEFDVVVQKTVTLSSLWRHPHGFEDPLFVHVPLDTFQQLRRFAPDAILSGEMGFRTLLAAVYRRLSKRCVLLISADVSEATEQGRGAARHLLRQFLKRTADGFIVNGKSGLRYLERLGVRQDKVFCVPYATDVQRFSSVDLRRDRVTARKLLYVGQLSTRKGLAPFIAGLSRWCQKHPDEKVQLTLLGDGPLRSHLSRMSVTSNLQLTISRPLPYNDVVHAYREAGVLVLPTLAETWGLVVNEGMAAGLPVLGSLFSPAVEELVVDDVNGWTFRPDDEKSMQDAIDRCMRVSDSALEQMRPLAHKSAARYSPEHVAALLGSAIRESIQRAHGSPARADGGTCA